MKLGLTRRQESNLVNTNGIHNCLKQFVFHTKLYRTNGLRIHEK